MAHESQLWSAEGYASHASFVPQLGQPVLELLDPKPGEDILDLGCGDGVLTREIGARGSVVVGVDSSPELLAAAREAGLSVRLMDGQALDFNAHFDAVFTNAALHWMPNLDAVVAGVHRALRPGGRFVGEFGGHGNVAAITTALRAALRLQGVCGPSSSPWIFPTAGVFRQLLETHGFCVQVLGLIPRPTPLVTGVAGWLETFAGPYLNHLDQDVRAAVIQSALELLAPSLQDESGQWTADYVRLRFAANRI